MNCIKRQKDMIPKDETPAGWKVSNMLLGKSRRQLLSHKKETMLSATTGMQRENITLSEATQRKTSITQFHLYVESKIEHK